MTPIGEACKHHATTPPLPRKPFRRQQASINFYSTVVSTIPNCTVTSATPACSLALGRAIANYERALLLDASNTKAQSNLDAARQGIQAAVSDTASGITLRHTFDAVAAGLGRFLSPAASEMLLAVTWILLWGTVLAGLYRSGRRWRYALIPATCLLLASTALAGLAHRSHTQDEHGIVAVRTAVLRQAPGDNFPAVTDQPLPEGQSLTVLHDRDSWLQVQTPDGQTGWIASPQLERVAPLQNQTK